MRVLDVHSDDEAVTNFVTTNPFTQKNHGTTVATSELVTETDVGYTKGQPPVISITSVGAAKLTVCSGPLKLRRPTCARRCRNPDTLFGQFYSIYLSYSSCCLLFVSLIYSFTLAPSSVNGKTTLCLRSTPVVSLVSVNWSSTSYLPS